MYFNLWRKNGFPTQFYQISIPTTYDPHLLTFTYAVGLIAAAFVLIIPGYRGIRRLYFTCRVGISLFILWVICMGAFGQNWEEGYADVTTPYKTFSKKLIDARVGIKVGLSSVNVTLKTNPIEQNIEAGVVELVDFNERMEWDWRQGREGYGSFSGKLQQQYRNAQKLGAPLAVLWIWEYFTIDEESIRWGRSFRTAGWFTWGLLLTSFPFWVVANLLSLEVSFYAGFFFFVTGGIMLTSNVVWATIRWGTQPLEIYLEGKTIHLQLGGSFYLVVAGGILSCTYGLIIVVLDFFAPQVIAAFLNTDTSDKDYYPPEENEMLETNDSEEPYQNRRRKTVIQRMRPTRKRKTLPDHQIKASVESNDQNETQDDDEGLRLRRTTSTTSGASQSPPSYKGRSYDDLRDITTEDEVFVQTRM